MQEWTDGAGTPLDREELSKNPFFLKLKSEYPELYVKAAVDNFLLCVPHSATLGAIHYDEKLFKAHLLRTSPYFKEEYVTGNGQCVSLRDSEISTKTGFEGNRLVKMLFEETFYNDEFKSFRVICISAPLSGKIGAPTPKDMKGKILGLTYGERTHSHWKLTIVSLLGDHAAVELIVELDKFIRQFNDTYVMMRGYTSDAAKKINVFVKPLLDEAVNSELLAQPLTENQAHELHLAVETYVMWHLHTKIWTQLYKHNSAKDEALNLRLEKLKDVTFEDMGLNLKFLCDLAPSRHKFSQIPSRLTPIGMLSAVKETTDTLRCSIEDHIRQQEEETETFSQAVLAADDMLAFVSLIIIQTRVPRLGSLVEYLENFHTTRSITSELDYGLATLSGALSYVRSPELDKYFGPPAQEPPAEPPKRSMSPMARPSRPGPMQRPHSTMSPRMQPRALSPRRAGLQRRRSTKPRVVTGDIPTRSRRRKTQPPGNIRRYANPEVTKARYAIPELPQSGAPPVPPLERAPLPPKGVGPEPPRRHHTDRGPRRQAGLRAQPESRAARAQPGRFHQDPEKRHVTQLMGRQRPPMRSEDLSQADASQNHPPSNRRKREVVTGRSWLNENRGQPPGKGRYG